MSGFVQQIFMYLAGKFGLELQRKTEIQNSDYFDIEDISITAAIAGRIATLTLMDSDVNVVGENARAKYLNYIMQELENDQLKTAVEVALGTGDCLLKPYTDGEGFGFSIIPSENFVVVDKIGNKIKSCLIECDSFTKDNTVYERIEFHKIAKIGDSKVVEIKQLAFKNGKEIPIGAVDKWADMQDVIIPNVDSLLFGRIKCPMVNRGDLNSINGVPITYGLNKVVNNSKEAYDRFNQEMADKETMIFADKTLLTKGENGRAELPKGKKKLFQLMRSRNMDSELIKEYSPDIRDDSLMQGIEQNFKMLELLAGLSQGILTTPTTRYATATEMKSTLQMSFSFIQRLRKNIEQAINDLLQGTSLIMNRNNTTPMGDYEIIYNWSDSYIQDLMSRFTSLLQGEAIGVIDGAEVRAFIQNEPLEVAKEKINEMKDVELEPIDGDAKQTAQEVAGKTLNGAQTNSLLNVLERYQSGDLSIGQAINILSVSIGVSKEDAKAIIEGVEG